ncbi:MAG: PRC-barrel domain protein, partial [Eggerthellaceae bacterium]|nr:PRC-barrel domain protein [Eggerthellaceae bacterium]
EDENGEEVALRGAIVVSDEVDMRLMEGGVAEKAGQQAAVMQDKVRRTVKPKAQEAARKTGDAINKGAFATGRQLGRAKGMFSAFKEEFDKASGGSGKKPKR